jgi:glycosyltransferase involved in cell wall biosynthesis
MPERRLRLSVVTETYPPEINGVARTVGRMLQEAVAAGHELEVVRPDQGRAEGEELAGVASLRVGAIALPRYPGLRMGWPAYGRLVRHWRQKRPDGVHLVTEGPLGLAALAAARRLGIPLTSALHTNFDAYGAHYGLGWLRGGIAAYLRAFHNATQCTFVPTQRQRDALLAAGYRRVEVLARGVDAELFSPARRDPALRRHWGVGEEGLAVLYVGRLAPEKNLDLLARAFQAIAAHRPEAKLVVVGEGPMAARWRRDHPEFVFCGARRGEDLAAHYASADLFLFPSLTETFGNVVLEAMASGLPLVGYDEAAVAECVEDGVSGLSCPPGDEDSFIARACRIAADAPLRRRLGTAARAAAARRSWAEIFRQAEAVLCAVLQEGGEAVSVTSA